MIGYYSIGFSVLVAIAAIAAGPLVLRVGNAWAIVLEAIAVSYCFLGVLLNLATPGELSPLYLLIFTVLPVACVIAACLISRHLERADQELAAVGDADPFPRA
jgi:hypothetical protein